MRATDYDTAGERTGGIPTYPYRLAPDGYATRRQLRAMGLRPNGQPVAAQIVWRRGRRVAYLYPIAGAAPVRPMTPARWSAVRAAVAARRICPICRCDAGYVIPPSVGTCNPCAADPAQLEHGDQLAAA